MARVLPLTNSAFPLRYQLYGAQRTMTNKQRSSLCINYITPTHWGFDNISAMHRPNLLMAKRLSWFKRSNNWDTKTALDLDFSSNVTDESHIHIGETLTGSDPAAQATAGAALIRAKHLAQVIQYDVSAAPTLSQRLF